MRAGAGAGTGARRARAPVRGTDTPACGMRARTLRCSADHTLAHGTYGHSNESTAHVCACTREWVRMGVSE